MNSKYDTWWGFSHIYLMFIFFLVTSRVLGVFCACGVSKKLWLVPELSACLYGYLWVDDAYDSLACFHVWVRLQNRPRHGMDGVNKVNNRQRLSSVFVC